MAYVAQISPGNGGPVVVTMTIGNTPVTTVPPTTTPPTTLPPAHPGAASPAPNHPLPITGAPILAGVDLALLLTVAGALLVSIANRLSGRPANAPAYVRTVKR